MKGEGLSLVVRLGSFPVPAGAARLYLGIVQTSRGTRARASMQDTLQKKRVRGTRGDDGGGAASSSGGQGGSSSGANGGAARSSGGQGGSNRATGPKPRTFSPLAQYVYHQPGCKAEYMTPATLFKDFIAACRDTRSRGTEHVALLLGGVVGEISTTNDVRIQITHLVFPEQVASKQSVDADTASQLSLLEAARAQYGENLEIIGWIHDHHVLPDEPTIDHDCWTQYSLQQDNPFFVMLITGIKAATARKPPQGDEWYDETNWCSWYSLQSKARKEMAEAQRKCKKIPAQKQRLREAMGHECSIKDYVRKLNGKQRKDAKPTVIITKLTNELVVVQPPSYQKKGGPVRGPRVSAGGGPFNTSAAADVSMQVDMNEVSDSLLLSYAVLAKSSVSAWASLEDLMTYTGRSPSTFAIARDRCFNPGEIAIIGGYSRRFEYPSLRHLPLRTGNRLTDIVRCVDHFGLHYRDGDLTPDDSSARVPPRNI